LQYFLQLSKLSRATQKAFTGLMQPVCCAGLPSPSHEYLCNQFEQYVPYLFKYKLWPIMFFFIISCGLHARVAYIFLLIERSRPRVGNLFSLQTGVSLALFCKPALDIISVNHHGTDSVRDLGLLCHSKMSQPVGTTVINGSNQSHSNHL